MATGNSYRKVNDTWQVDASSEIQLEVRGRVRGTNTAPAFAVGQRRIGFPMPEPGQAVDVEEPVTATDADEDSLAYSLSGPDASSFTVDQWSGRIRTRSAVTYDTTNTYSVTVTADDRRGGTDTMEVIPAHPQG